MYVKENLNPQNKNVGDCVIRAISKVLNQSWGRTYLELAVYGFAMADLQSADAVWGQYMYDKGFKKALLSVDCPNCMTVREFAELQGRRNPTSTDCQKLAAYYTILDHLADVTDDEIRGASAMPLYSRTEPQSTTEIISYTFNNKALNDGLNGRTSDYAYWLLDELMTACSVVDMRLYSFLERKLKE